MNKKLNLTKIILITALIFIGWQNFFNDEPEIIPDPVTVKIPETTGASGIVNLEPEVVIDTVYVKGDVIEIDKGYKELYEKAKDSLEKKELYLEAIQIKKYSDTIVDNDEITIKGKATTRGSLLDYSVDYTIKEKEFTYIPEIVSRFPKLSLGLGLEVGVPLMLDDPMVIKANLSVINKKGKEFGVSYDTNGTVWVGAKIIIKLRK